MKAVGYMIGGGSMSLGVEAAGFEILDVFENKGFSKNAPSWDANRKGHIRLEDDMPFPGGDYRADLIYGNPPCGGLSMMRNAKYPDSSHRTNQIMQRWMEAVTAARPRMILMENAPGLSSRMGDEVRGRLFSMLESAGYDYWVWRFKSWQLGTPQYRPRTFVCGSLAAVSERWKSTLDLPTKSLPPGAVTPTIALAPTFDVDPVDGDTVDAFGNQLTAHWYDKGGEVAMERNRLYGQRWWGGNYISRPLLDRYKERAANGDESSRKIVEEMEHKLWEDCPEDLHYPMQFGMPRPLNFELPFSTIITTPNMMIQRPSGEWRVLTVREHATMMGFPGDWKIPKPYRIHHFGQGVPANNARWAAARLLSAVSGERPPRLEGELEQFDLLS